jgi:hypothetical protein
VWLRLSKCLPARVELRNALNKPSATNELNHVNRRPLTQSLKQSPRQTAHVAFQFQP